MLIFSQRSKFCGNTKRGFTLIELLVVVSIMLILTTIFLFRQQQFNSSTLLRTLAYSVALSVRQAQVYGTSVRETATNSLVAPDFAAAYGLYFSAATPTSYVLFADKNNNNQYDVANETLETFTLPRGYVINGACVVEGSTKHCTAGGTALLDTSGIATLTHMHILFKRPNPEAVFNGYFNAGAVAGTYTSAYIQIGANTSTRSVTINATGQIVVTGLGT